MPTVKTEINLEIHATTYCPACGARLRSVVGYREDMQDQVVGQLERRIKLHLAAYHGGPAPDVPDL